MPTIQILPDILASQVAAGEVIERPASVVKELIENSLDAGANDICVEIAQGGVTLIRIQDNGSGMTRENALLSLERHATSKIKQADDLQQILSFGFRGEAIPSISSVSHFRMLTRDSQSSTATEILLSGGKLRDVREAASTIGTSIEVQSLFFNIPARRKFLRSTATEAAYIEHEIRLHALSYPEVKFRFIKDQRVILDLAATSQHQERIRQLIGTTSSKDLIHLTKTESANLSIHGFLLPPQYAKKGRRHQWIFLNRRPIEDSIISRAILEGIENATPEGTNPAIWLWLEMPPHLVDVNVHPAKKEVRFQQPLELRRQLSSIIQEAISQKQTVPTPPPAPLFLNQDIQDNTASLTTPKPSTSAATTRMNWSWSSQKEINLPIEETYTTAAPVTSSLRQPTFIPLVSLHQRFVLLQSQDGLVVLDPKAACERIIYEQFTKQKSLHATQSLLIPIILELDPRDHTLLLEHRSALLDIGLEINPFGNNTIQIQSMPAGLSINQPMLFFNTLIDELLHESGVKHRFAYERLAQVLAHQASKQVKHHFDDTMALLTQLFQCSLPYCTATGKPTIIEFSLSEISKRFHQK